MRHHEAGLDETGALLVRRQVLDALGERPDLVADRLGLRRQFDRLLADDALPGQVGEFLGSTGRVEVVEQRGGAPHVEVRVVLPGDRDAAVDLGVQVGAQIGRGSGQGGRGRCRVGELVATGGRRAGSVPHGARRKFGGHGHVGAVVLDRLVHGDRTTELDALLRVGGTHLRALAGDADSVGRQDHTGEVDERAPRSGDDRDGRAVERHADAGPARIEAGRRLDRDAVARLDDGHHGDVVTNGYEQHRRRRPAEHHSGVTRGGAVGHRHRPAERDSADRRAIGEAGEQPRSQVVVAGGGDQRAGDHRRHERTRRDRPGEFLDDDDQLLDAVAGSADVLRQVQTEPTELRELGPEFGQRVVGRLEPLASGAAQVALLGETAHGLGERAMVLGDGDRHGELTSRDGGVVPAGLERRHLPRPPRPATTPAGGQSSGSARTTSSQRRR